MGNKFDARSKVARSNEQEYAHQYVPKTREDDYQYGNEQDRVTYHVHDEDDNKTQEELYGIEPEQVIDFNNNNKIKVVVDTENVTEDHRQRSYKIKTQPQIYSKSDPDIDSMQNQNDHREDEINRLRETSKHFSEQIDKENNTDITDPVKRFSLEEEPEDNCEVDFNVGDKVVHSEENISGEVKFVNDKRVAIVWEDNTRERFAIKEAKEFLKVTKAYVGDVQEQVDPVHTPDWPKNPELEEKIDNSLSSMEKDDNSDITADLDLEKIKLKRQVTELETKVNEIDIEKIKTKAAKEVISLMQKKGLLSNDENEVQEQFNNIVQMNDEAFEAFKKVIISTKNNAKSEEDEIYDILGENDDFSDIEDGNTFAQIKKQIQKSTNTARSMDGIEMGDTSMFENGMLSNFKGNIGDFSGASKSLGSSNGQETRSLTANDRSNNRNNNGNSSLDMSGFQNLQGLTTPINIPNRELSAGGKFSELFSNNFGWSGVPKR